MLTATRKTPSAPPRRDENGQVLILFVALTPIIFLAAAIAIEYGLWLADRRGVARAADLSSLAAVQDMPVTPNQQSYTAETDCDATLDSCRAAFDWAKRNNYEAGKDGVEVTVSYWCGNNLQTQPTNITVCVNENASDGGKSECSASLGKTDCDTIRVRVQKPAVRLFAGLFPAASFDVEFSADASVNYRVKHLDAALAIDASGSMKDREKNPDPNRPKPLGEIQAGCDEDPPDPQFICPIWQARKGADNFTTVLLGDDPQSSNVQIGYTPYRDGHDDPPYANPPGSDGKVPWIGVLTTGNCNPPPADSWAACLTKDDELLRDKFDLTVDGVDSGVAGGTNTCIGLTDAGDLVLGPNSNSLQTDPQLDRVIVMLSDGDNNGNTALDGCTFDKANALNDPANGVDIYVIGLNVAGSDDGAVHDPGYCNNVGSSVDNRRLLKCIASSANGTNDHYHETDDAGDLGNIFLNLAYEIAGRALSGN